MFMKKQRDYVNCGTMQKGEYEMSKDQFEGMTDRESVQHQLNEWVKGNPLHNTVRDECCPDFSCCGNKMMDKELRLKFEKAHDEGDGETEMNILGMALSGLTASIDKNVHIAGEDTTLN